MAENINKVFGVIDAHDIGYFGKSSVNDIEIEKKLFSVVDNLPEILNVEILPLELPFVVVYR